MTNKARLLILLGLLVGSVIVLPAVYAQSNNRTWTPPLPLGDGWWQSMVTDREGRLHVTWYGGFVDERGDAQDQLIYTALNLDGTWTPPRDVIYTGSGGYTIRNALVITNDGILHTIFRNRTFHLFANAPARAANSAANWTAPVDISAGGYYVGLLADNDDVLHLIFSGGNLGRPIGSGEGNLERNPCAYCNDLFYRRSTDGGANWSTPFPLSEEPLTGSDRMDIFEGSNGRIYVIWDEGYDWYAGKGSAQDVRIRYTDDGGLTWSEPIILDGGDFPYWRPIQIASAELRDGSLMAVWRYSSDVDPNVYYQLSSDSGVTWTSPQPIPGFIARRINDTPLDDYDLVVDYLGAVHLFAVGLPNNETRTNASLYHVEYRQGTWLPPQRVFYSPDMRPEWPKARLGLENDIHLTFFTRGLRFDVKDYAKEDTGLKVFYTHMIGNLPSRATEVFRPTLTPQPTATVFQQLDPTPTAVPTTEPLGEATRLTTRDVYAAETFLGGLFATAIFCGAIYFLNRAIRRR